VLGDLVWLVVVPAAFLVRNPPAAAEAAAAAHGGGETGFTVGQALRTPQFAAIALAHFACCAAHSGPIFHMVTNVLDHGITAMAAATVLSVAGLSSFAGKIVCGLVADRVGAKLTLVIGLAIQAAAISLYLVTRELWGFYAVALIFGFAYGGVMPLYAVVVREYFGARIMGSVFGAVSTVATLGMALGPVIGGRLYDGLGSYAWMFVGSFGIGLAAVVIALAFRPPRPVVVLTPRTVS
jgi:MFS family permease